MMLRSENLAQTAKVGRLISSFLRGGDVVLLNGDLGAGKTTLTKEIAKNLGVKATVTSPTFTIIKEYELNNLTLYHIDLYRLEDKVEISELGIEECFFEDSIVIIEWNKLDSFVGRVINIDIKAVSTFTRDFKIEGLV